MGNRLKRFDYFKHEYYPVYGDPQNGFYPVPIGEGTYIWNGEKIVLKEDIKAEEADDGK